MNNLLNLSSLEAKGDTMCLAPDEMEMITGGCVTGKANAVVTGFCTLGSFLNPFVAGGCAAYGVYELFSCT